MQLYELACSSFLRLSSSQEFRSACCQVTGTGMGNGQGMGLGIQTGMGNGNGKVPPVPGDDSIISQATHHLTFNHEGALVSTPGPNKFRNHPGRVGLSA